MAEETTGGGTGPAMIGNLSTGEMLLGFGAAWLFFINYVIGNRLASDYGVSVLVTVSTLALAVLAAIFFSKRGGDAAWKSLYPTVAVAAGWGIVVLAVLDLVDGIVNNFSRSGEFYEITFYIASAVIAAGAYQLSQGK